MVDREDGVGLREECVCVCVYSLVSVRNSPTPTIPSLSSFFHPYSQITHGQCLQPPLGKSFQGWRRKDIDMGWGGKGRRTEGIRDKAKPVAVPEFL